MALVEVKVPQLSESVAEATLLQWKKKPGDAVAIDETLIEIETDKVVLEVPAPAAGVMAEIVKPDGSTVVGGDLIAKLDTDGKAPAKKPAAEPAAAPTATTPAGGAKGDIAMPAAAKMLADAGMSPSQVSGTGKDGRVTKGDVIEAKAKPATAPTPAPAARPALPEVKRRSTLVD
jgi:2-oxoglutarate dehydrogenase E2 component (dihydrolipoamide succinyltransferase)